MSTLKLQADPTFKEKVGIPLHGGDPVFVEFTFKHKTQTEFDTFNKEFSNKAISDTQLSIETDCDYVLGIAEAWELDEPFTRESLKILFENRPGASPAITRAYVLALRQVKLGN